jgi:acetate kinase
MNILVFNCGSSSLSYKVFETNGPESLRVLVSGKAHRVGVHGDQPAYLEHLYQGQTVRRTTTLPDHRTAASQVLTFLSNNDISVGLIGHRFVHGGTFFNRSTLLTGSVMERLMQVLPLAPIHNPNSMSVIEVCRKIGRPVPQYVTFDNAFHATLDEPARAYALPQKLVAEHGIQKYGFHGLSYQYVSRMAARFLSRPIERLKMVACHLGTGGSSVTAIRGGKSIDTSMGYSPLSGLVMSTRTGDLDPLLPLYLMDEHGLNPQELTEAFNKRSGLLGLSGGISSDLRDLLQRHEDGLQGAEAARLAFDVYTYRLKKYIGAYVALLGGLDALIFTDDIGLFAWQVRQKVCSGMQWCGLHISDEANRQAPVDRTSNIADSSSSAAVLIVPTDEELIIGMEGLNLIQEAGFADL